MLLRRVCRCPGKLFWERVAPVRVYHRKSERLTHNGKTHDICIHSFLFKIDTSGRARGCCGVVLRRRGGGPRGVHKLSRHTPQTRCLMFVWHHSVMRAVISFRFTRSHAVFCETCLGQSLNAAFR